MFYKCFVFAEEALQDPETNLSALNYKFKYFAQAPLTGCQPIGYSEFCSGTLGISLKRNQNNSEVESTSLPLLFYRQR